MLYRRSNALKVLIIIIFALLLGYFDLPSSSQVLPGTPDAFKNAKIHLGLDLQGGSQLDYKIDLRKVPAKDQKAITEGVKTVINRRVNSLGVSEPNIYTSTVGNEQHLIVELAGIKDLNEAKKVVGKIIQLEFKEKREKEDPDYKANVKKLGAALLSRVLSGKDSFEIVGQEEAQASPEKIAYKETDWTLKSDVADQKLAAKIFTAEEGKIIPTLMEGDDGYTFKDGELTPLNGFFIIKMVEKRDTSTLPEKEKALEASHILVSYRGADKAPDTVLRSKEEAKVEAEGILAKLKAGANFEATAKESSDEPGAKDSAGKLTAPVRLGGDYDPAFTEAALKLTRADELSEVTETPFGFHIIRADSLVQAKYEQIFISSAPDPWQETGLTGEHFEYAEVTFDKFGNPTVSIRFNPKGADLFEKITERNVSKPVAIFVGGVLISKPNVNEKISGGNAVITGSFSADEAQALARDLNTGAIPAPIVLSGQYTIGATLGSEALQTSLKAGLIGIIILALFMILFYRLPGFVAVVALSIYTAILLFMIKSQLPLAIGLLVAIGIFIAIIYTILKGKDDGWEKFISFVLACFILFFVTFLLSNTVVLTLAGVAGVILSIGMAVDANILIFERTKEELRAGRPLANAVDVGFDRAWSSIRDSNFSSLITCGILFYFGTSIIQGFAFNLAAGILISMFTAITITKTLLKIFMSGRLNEKLWLWGLSKKEQTHRTELMGQGAETETSVHTHAKVYPIIEKTKTWFAISGTVLIVSLIAIVFFGLKLGIDFKGGTLMDVTFTAPTSAISADSIKEELKAIGLTLGRTTTSAAISEVDGEQMTSGEEIISLEDSRVVTAGENQFLLNLQHIANAAHDKILEGLQAKFGDLTENRFTTIGPTVGDSLKQRAVIAVLVAIVMIVLYIAFAFRRVPKRVNAWKFGVCAILALIHDVIIPIGVFALFRLEVDALFITAILTVLGFSVHDTIVVFDRIRENLRYQRRDESFTHVVNKSITETMVRSINTSLTVFITLMALLVFGSPSVFNFILVLVIGIVVGTYSSIFIASPLLVLWQKKDQQ